jgi:hypothetical protein
MTSDNIIARMTEGATMTSDHISATMICMTWCKEHLWKVSVLHIVHLSNLVLKQL